MVDPGNYLLFVKGVSGFSTTDKFIIGAIANAGFDAYEANDRANIATKLSGSADIIGNLDNKGDIDYFSYTNGKNQSESRLFFEGKGFHQLQIFSGSKWMNVPSGQVIKLASSPGSQGSFRVLAKSDTTFNSIDNYRMRLTPPSVSINNAKIWSNENLTNLLSAGMVEAHKKLNISGKVVGAEGKPVAGDRVNIRVGQ